MLTTNLFDLQRATKAARVRTSNAAIGTQVKAGKIQVVEVTFGRSGASTVTPMTGFVSAAEAVKFLDAL